MLCENCRENEVNFKYTEVINGNKREISLCDKCAKKLGLQSLDFEKSFAGVFEDMFDISSAGKLSNLFNMSYTNELDDLFNIPYTNSLENLFNLSLFDSISEKNKINSNLTKQEKQDVLNDIEKVINKKQKNNEEINKKQKLQIELEKAIKEERYEDAAKIRDEIKNIPE